MDPVITKTKKLTRDKLAQFLPSHEAIKAFEDITSDVTEALPNASDANAAAAEAAQDSADFAQITADAAGIAAQNAQLTANEALNATGDAATDPGPGALWSYLLYLEGRIAALEQGTTP